MTIVRSNSGSYDAVKATLSTLLLYPVSRATSATPSSSAKDEEMLKLKRELEEERVQRQVLVSGIMATMIQNRQKIKELE